MLHAPQLACNLVVYHPHLLSLAPQIYYMAKATKEASQAQALQASRQGANLGAPSKPPKGDDALEKLREALDEGRAKAKGCPFEEMGTSVEKILSSSAEPSQDSSLTKVGRALQKHSSRPGSPFADIEFSHKTGSQVGEQVLKEILDPLNRIEVREPNRTVTCYNTVTGRGANISRSGIFNGFRKL